MRATQTAVVDHPPPGGPASKDPRSRPKAGRGVRLASAGRSLLAAVALVLGLAGAGIARTFDQSNEGNPSAGKLVSADGKPGDPGSVTDRVVCWDGHSTLSLRGCGSPSGLRGLAWVFPSIQPEACEAIGSVGRPQAWSCPVSLEGRDATIVYGELFSVADGVDHYDAVYENGVAQRKTVGARYVWKAKERNVREVWQFSSMYVAEPWSVHVESVTRKGAKLAFKSVEFRSPDELQGVVATD